MYFAYCFASFLSASECIVSDWLYIISAYECYASSDTVPSVLCL